MTPYEEVMNTMFHVLKAKDNPNESIYDNKELMDEVNITAKKHAAFLIHPLGTSFIQACVEDYKKSKELQ